MPDMPTPSQTPTPTPPGAAQAAPGAATQGQPPIGSSPATQPVANRGMQAAGLAKVQVAVHILESVLPMLGAGSEAGKAVLDSLNKLSKHVAPGSISSGVEQNGLQEMLMKLRQNAPQIAAMRAGQPAGAGQPPAPGGAPAGGGIPPQLAAMMQPQGNA